MSWLWVNCPLFLFSCSNPIHLFFTPPAIQAQAHAYTRTTLASRETSHTMHFSTTHALFLTVAAALAVNAAPAPAATTSSGATTSIPSTSTPNKEKYKCNGDKLDQCDAWFVSGGTCAHWSTVGCAKGTKCADEVSTGKSHWVVGSPAF